MVSSVLDIRVDVSRENNFQAILAKQYDKSTRFLRVTVTDQGVPLVIEETCKVAFNIRRPDKETRAFAGSVNPDGTLRIPLPAWGLALDGTCSCDISIYGIEGERLSTMGFKLVVKFSTVDGSNILENENYDILLPMINALQIYENERREYCVPPDVTAFYYNSLADCIADINEGINTRHSGTSSENVCCVYEKAGLYTLTLLKNITTTTRYTVEADVVFNLAGHVINADLRASGAGELQSLFVFNGRHVLINAVTGGKIRLKASNACGILHVSSACREFRVMGGVYNVSCEASDSDNAAIRLYAQKAYIANAEIAVDKQESETVDIKNTYAIQAAGCELSIDHCDVHVTDGGGSVAVGVYCSHASALHLKGGMLKAVGNTQNSYGIYCVDVEKLLMDEEPYIYTDAADNSPAGNRGCARAVFSRADHVSVNGGTYIGTYNGISLQAGEGGEGFAHIKNANIYSCGNGGFYITENVTAFFENCEIGLRDYDGRHDADAMSGERCGFCIGGTSEHVSGISVYLNSCHLLGSGAVHCGVLRGTNGEHGNKLCISNTTYPEGKKFRIDGENYLYAGRNSHITASDVEQNGGEPVLEGALRYSDYVYSHQAVPSNETRDQIGNFDGLATDAHDSLVDAINCNHGRLNTVEEHVEESEKLLRILLSGSLDNLSYSNLRDIVRSGKASDWFRIGDQIIVPWRDAATDTEYAFPFDIVHIGEAQTENGQRLPAMYLQLHYATPFGVQFDHPEDEVATEERFSIDYQYYAANPEAGVGLYRLLESGVDYAVGDSIPNGQVYYHSAIKDPSGAIVKNGYSRWSHSAVRQFLNSRNGVGEWWSPQHLGDVAPDELSAKAGFLSGFPSDFLAVLQPIRVVTSRESVTGEATWKETTYDTFFLPSPSQIFAERAEESGEGEAFAYWREAVNQDTPVGFLKPNPAYINYRLENPTVANYVDLRSPWPDRSGAVTCIDREGQVTNDRPSFSNRYTPVCAIC